MTVQGKKQDGYLSSFQALSNIQVAGGLIDHVDVRLLGRHHRYGKALQLTTWNEQVNERMSKRMSE
jgi:hypothetical protein